MASSLHQFPFFFLLLTILFSFLHIHARESQFFSKVTNTNTNNPKENLVPINKQELPLTNNDQKQEVEPSFIPQSQDSGYGLYGHQSEPTTTNNKNEAYVSEPQAMSDTRFMEKGYTTPINGANMYNQENNYNNGDGNMYNQEKQGMSDTRFMEKEYTSAPVDGYEYVNGVNVYGQDKGTSDTRFMEKGYTTPINSNEYYNGANMYNPEKQGMSDTRFMEKAYTTPINYNNGGNMYNPEKQGMSDTRFMEKGYTTPINSGNMYNQEKQGMSDTRFLENGKYYYDPNTENYNSLNANDNSRGVDLRYEYNSRGNYGNNGNSYEFNNNANSMEFQNQDDMP